MEESELGKSESRVDEKAPESFIDERVILRSREAKWC